MGGRLAAEWQFPLAVALKSQRTRNECFPEKQVDHLVAIANRTKDHFCVYCKSGEFLCKDSSVIMLLRLRVEDPYFHMGLR